MEKNAKIFIAGHRGLVGSAIVKNLKNRGYTNIVVKTRQELDLTNSESVAEFFKEEKIEFVFLAAAKVGGIVANNIYRADFIYENLMIQNNVIHAAHMHGVERLLFLGSSCIYPKMAHQPMTESSLLTGVLEETNEPYAIAKIAGIKMCQSYNRQYGHDYRSVMPTNLYGPFDNFHPENSHVIPGLIHKFDLALREKAPVINLWGTGTPKREFLHVDDMANASVHVMNLSRERFEQSVGSGGSHINVGTGEDCQIRELATLLTTITGYQGELAYDTTRPDGTPRKLLDVTKLHDCGWHHRIDLEQGLHTTWKWYQDNRNSLRLV